MMARCRAKTEVYSRVCGYYRPVRLGTPARPRSARTGATTWCRMEPRAGETAAVGYLDNLVPPRSPLRNAMRGEGDETRT